MNTTGPVMTVTDELLAELEAGINSMTMRTAYVSLIVAEIGRLRAENAELAQSLAESRANDQAAMGWLTSLRWASGDRGERMLPELVSHIEGLAKDAGRYRWIVKKSTYGISYRQCPELTLPIYAPNHRGGLGDAIDTAMATQ